MAQELGGASRRHLRMLFSVGAGAGLSDARLLERFATARGEASELAFAALVERHGPVVLRACRGVLRDEHEAQDAFQATFLILARKGRTLWVRDSLAPWLHRVACRVAGRARVVAERRRRLERRAAERPPGRSPGEGCRELAAILHEEVDRLPDRYRGPVVLCDLDGRTYEEAARALGCPQGTVKSRLARGRERLRRRLIRRGLAPSAAILGAGSTVDAAPAAITDALVTTTIEAATLFAHGTKAAGVVPATVLELAEGVLKMMFRTKLKLVASGLLLAVGLAIGAGALAHQATKDRPPDPPIPEAGTQSPRARPPEGDRRWTRTLPSGATIEVVAISPHPTEPNSWWGPDGTPLAKPPCDPPKTIITSDSDVNFRAIAARTTGLPPGAVPGSGWIARGAKGGYSGSPAYRDGEAVPDMRVIVTAFPRNLETCTVDVLGRRRALDDRQVVGRGRSACGGPPGRPELHLRRGGRDQDGHGPHGHA